MWPSSGRPVALAKRVFVMPMRCAYWFISAANASSLPATCSASAIAASLPDCTTMPFSISSSGAVLLTSKPE